MVVKAGIVTGDTVWEPSLASWSLAMKSEEGNKATFSHWPRFDTLFATQSWILLQCLTEAKAIKKAVLRVRCLRSLSFVGSKGAFVSSLSTTERFHLGRFLELLDENWRVTCEGQTSEKSDAQLGPKCQQWQSYNHQWSRGTCSDLDTDTWKCRRLSQREGRNPPNFLCIIFQVGPTLICIQSLLMVSEEQQFFLPPPQRSLVLGYVHS